MGRDESGKSHYTRYFHLHRHQLQGSWEDGGERAAQGHFVGLLSLFLSLDKRGARGKPSSRISHRQPTKPAVLLDSRTTLLSQSG